ncbi:deaminase-reductase domain-containing protein [Candidatus Nitrosarchaeum limnium SFB1]|jgi:2,5-diamino-6-(ribosylamino)-4(3H)-pyrimidinone 5'-phosphate reductase|uniref:2,5-diamino-6-(ribosylamino)-4(3H)-pyrimidinone 5'-phosphate reductase n=1 Tax=Candidatus Nitrosarchaeum limnium SFB1 TaxID=886738 RepID=F3KLJ0_9ARCH|nr:deaminase-reductase domain-containing protein [Candidatus Nitrosarchaeum limnium SFB1]
MEKSRPHVILSAAISIDGKIASRSGDSKLSSQIDKVRLHKLRSKVDAILVGKNTVQRDDPLLTVRYTKGKNPIRIILDSQGTIPINSKILQTCDKVPTIIAVSRKISNENLKKLNKFPVEIIMSGENLVNIKSLMTSLSKRKIKTILVEGGGTVNWQFIQNKMFDEIFITISPFIIGGTDAVTFVQGKGFDKIIKSPKLRLNSIKKLENYLVLHYTKV